MGKEPKKTPEEKLTIGAWSMAAVAVTLIITYWVFLRKELPPEIPLFYSQPWGKEQLASPVMLMLPLGMVVITGIMVSGWAKLLRSDRVLKIMILTSGLVFQLLLLLSVIRVLGLVL